MLGELRSPLGVNADNGTRNKNKGGSRFVALNEVQMIETKEAEKRDGTITSMSHIKCIELSIMGEQMVEINKEQVKKYDKGRKMKSKKVDTHKRLEIMSRGITKEKNEKSNTWEGKKTIEKLLK